MIFKDSFWTQAHVTLKVTLWGMHSAFIFHLSNKQLQSEEVNYLFEVISHRYSKVERELYVLNDNTVVFLPQNYSSKIWMRVLLYSGMDCTFLAAQLN